MANSNSWFKKAIGYITGFYFLANTLNVALPTKLYAENKTYNLISEKYESIRNNSLMALASGAGSAASFLTGNSYLGLGLLVPTTYFGLKSIDNITEVISFADINDLAKLAAKGFPNPYLDKVTLDKYVEDATWDKFKNSALMTAFLAGAELGLILYYKDGNYAKLDGGLSFNTHPGYMIAVPLGMSLLDLFNSTSDLINIDKIKKQKKDELQKIIDSQNKLIASYNSNIAQKNLKFIMDIPLEIKEFEQIKKETGDRLISDIFFTLASLGIGGIIQTVADRADLDENSKNLLRSGASICFIISLGGAYNTLNNADAYTRVVFIPDQK